MVVLFSLRGFVFWARSGKAELAVLYTFEVYVTIVYPLTITKALLSSFQREFAASAAVDHPGAMPGGS